MALRLFSLMGLAAASGKAIIVGRARLVRTHFQRDVEDPLLYDAVWNTDAVPIPVIAKLVIQLADQRREAWLRISRERKR